MVRMNLMIMWLDRASSVVARFSVVLALLWTLFPGPIALADGPSEIKTLFLNPTAFYERDVHVAGHIRVVGVGESWFVLEDGTGRLLVTTAGVAGPLSCGQGARAALKGRLLSLGDEHGLYFALQEMQGCSASERTWTRRVAEWLGLGHT